jgi:hypothetical protein
LVLLKLLGYTDAESGQLFDCTERTVWRKTKLIPLIRQPIVDDAGGDRDSRYCAPSFVVAVLAVSLIPPQRVPTNESALSF